MPTYLMDAKNSAFVINWMLIGVVNAIVTHKKWFIFCLWSSKWNHHMDYGVMKFSSANYLLGGTDISPSYVSNTSFLDPFSDGSPFLSCDPAYKHSPLAILATSIPHLQPWLQAFPIHLFFPYPLNLQLRISIRGTAC